MHIVYRTLALVSGPKHPGQWAVTGSWIQGGLFLHLQPVHNDETAASKQSLSNKEAVFMHNLIRSSVHIQKLFPVKYLYET
jgi:hypothetical protein